MASACSLTSSRDQRSKANSIELRSRSRNNGLTSVSKLTGSVESAIMRAPFGSFDSQALRKSLDEVERGLGDLAPAVVDRQRVASIRHLHDLRHAGIALLPVVGGFRDRPGHRMVVLALDDQHGTAVGVQGVDLRLRPRVEVGVAHLRERDPGSSDMEGVVELLRLLFVQV